MEKSRKTIRGALITIVTLLILMLCFSLTPNAEEMDTNENENVINVWLIGGQSNAVGYGKGAPVGANEDSRYYTGFENVLYYGNHEQWKYNEDDFVPTSIGLGRGADNNDVRYTSSGSEIGIANALGDSGEMNAIIKFAYGGTYLYPKQSASVNDNAKTWTSPSYIAAHPEMNTGSNIGALYDLFVATVTEGIEKLEAAGYKPVIKGMWWMQGENEGMNETYASAYAELLECLVNDVRAELKSITGDDYSDLPFVCGNVMRNPADATQYPALETVNAAQKSVSEKLENVGVLAKSDYSSQSFFGYHDGWHFNADTYNYMGERFVDIVLDMTDEVVVSVSGEGIAATGSGIKALGSDAGVTVQAKAGYTVNSVSINGKAVTVSPDSSYALGALSDDVVVEIDTVYSGTDHASAYGTVPAEYNIPEKYPFVLFKNGSFVGAYEYYGKALAVVPTIKGTDSYTLLMRRDYATVPADMTSAATSFGGTFTLDLGGNTMVRGNRAYVLEIYSNDNNTYKTTLNVKNGVMYSSGDFSLVGLNYGSLSNVAKVYEINFESVTFKTYYSGRGTAVIIDSLDEAASTDGAGLSANVSFDGCTFDFGETSGTMMRFSNGTASKTVVTASVNGGAIISKTASYSLYTFTAEDKVTVGALNGAYPTVTLPATVTPPSYTYTTDSGKIYGILTDSGVTSEENTVYTMGEQSLNTKYGMIDEEYKDSGAYKFALFKVDSASDTGYTFVSGYSTFAEVCKAAGLKGSPVLSNTDFVILVRTSFTQAEGVDNMQAFFNNITIDFGGNTVTLTTQHLLPLYLGNPSSATTYGKITLKNGTVITNSPNNTSISAIRLDSGSISNNLTFNVDAEDVTFKVASGSKSLNGALSMSGNKGSAKLTVNSTFTNCTFDYTGAPLNTVMLSANASQRIANVNVVGGKIIANENNAFVFASLDASDTLRFKANSTGATAMLALKAGTSTPAEKIGNLEFAYLKTEDGNDVYGLVEKNHYGDIPAQYTSATDYPVLLFKPDKTFVKGYASFAEAAVAAGLVNGGANSQVNGEDAVILFRADHVHVGESGNMNGYYNDVVIDLGGHTVQIGSETVKKNFLVLYSNSNPANKTFGTITVKNGTFKNMWDNTGAICFNGGASVGEGVTYTVNYENVTFTVRNYTNKIYGAIRTWGDAPKNIVLNATYTDCTFDYTGANTNAGMFGLSYNSKTTTVFNITVNGGKIIGVSNGAFNFIEEDSADNVTLNGTTLYLTSGTSAPVAKYNGGTMSFAYTETVDGNDVYRLSETATNKKLTLSLADSSMTDMAKYALFVYVNGNLVSLPYSAEFASGTEITIVVRGAGESNYTVTVNGKPVDELKLTLTEDTSVSIGITEKATVNKIPVSSVTSSHSSANNTSWALDKIIDGNRTSGGSSYGYSTGALNVQSLTTPVVLTFDLGSVRKINQIAIFPRSDASALGGLLSCNYPVDFTVSVSADGNAYKTVLTVSGESSPVFAKQYCYSFADENAQYVKLTVTKVGELASNESGSTRYRLQLAEVEVYYNEELAVTEEYTLNISAENPEMAKYALTLYVNGKLTALPYTAILERGDTVTILAKGAGNKNYIVTINGTQTEELTIEMLDDTNIVIGVAKNPNAVKIPISSVTPSDKGYESNSSWKSANLIDGVISNGYTTGWKNNPDVSSNPFTLTFDLGSIKRINQVSIYPRMDAATVKAITESSLSAAFPRDFTISVSVDGTKYVNVLSVTNYETPLFRNQQSFNFEDVDARYVKLTVTKLGAAAYDDASAGRYRLQLTEFEVYYNSDVAFVNTEYGTVTGVYANEKNYPIAYFVVDPSSPTGYRFVTGYSDYKTAQDAAFSGNDSVILFRADYTNSNTKMIGAFYNNVTIDLGGYTVQTRHHFLALYGTGSPSNANFGTINVKNGTITIKDSLNNTIAPVRLDGKWNKQVTYTVNLENIRFTVDSASQSSFGAVSTSNPNGTNNVLNVTLTDCIFDFANSKSGTVMISASGSRIVNATIYGGKILAGANNSFNLVTNDSTDKIVFAKNNNEEYVDLILDKSAAAPSISTVYTTLNGVECVFVKASANDTTTTYKLMPKVMVDYKIKTSVTLWSNFVYNIYIPSANVNGFTVNGNTVEYTTETIGDVEYYVVKVDLPAGETLRDIALTVTLNSGNTTVDASWTLNVYNYTKSVLAGEYDETTKTLMKDMLVYASAAHTYFKNTETVAEKLAEIKTLLGDYAAEIPTGEAKAPADKTCFTDVAVYLGEVPSFRFYLASGYTASDFTFKVGNRTVEAIAGEGYVEIVMYAYMMLDDVTFTVKGTDVAETYNLYSYYEYASKQNDANLVAVVEALMKYSVSANAYRNSVINK